jgi:hypothetical protein
MHQFSCPCKESITNIMGTGPKTFTCTQQHECPED